MNNPKEWLLAHKRIGRRVLVYDQIDSTNTQAAQLAGDPSADGLVLLADSQTAGRGQYGRTWQSPPRSGVLTSVVLFPPPELRRPALLTAWAAVSVCEMLRLYWDLAATIKWPNDVLVQGRKICGILIECGSANGRFRVVAGLGFNVNQTQADFALAGLPLATSLRQVVGSEQDRDDVAQRLWRSLDEEYHRLMLGDLTSLETMWKDRIGLLDRPVIASCADRDHVGRLVELSWDGLWLMPEFANEPLCLSLETVRALKER